MILYSATNKLNGKTYIGITSVSLSHRMACHICNSKTLKSHFSLAIKKYGRDAFRWRVLDTAKNLEELKTKEKIYIDMFGTYFKQIGYNTTHGGDGLFGMNGERNTFYGKKHTAESRRKIKEARSRQVIVHSEATKRNLSLAKKGKKNSKEHTAKMTASKIAIYGRKVICVETGHIFNSIGEATRIMGYKQKSNIQAVLSGRNSIAGGYHWKYAEAVH